MKTINFTYEYLFNLLCGKSTLNPQSVGSRTFSFNTIYEKYNEQRWNLEYEDRILTLVRYYVVDLN